ncbi:MAG TPA: bifunctional glutamate N-acetyltransferase/amino-acid acetyltransferase ArgJ, partial [Thermoanaerobaculia bacterium]|nr:bifunctional glutamate N-acetyltransferase/amino-acid acetyltransferase ArgJ [Thermoanaerobaculia bacterium]
GFRFAAAASGMRFTGRDDLALIVADRPAAWAGVFTTSSAAGAPVLLARRRLARRKPVRAVLVNAGIANAGTGKKGLRDAANAAKLAAKALRVKQHEVLGASTGWIGERLQLGPIRKALPDLVAGLSPEGHRRVARAMMTSDRVPKHAVGRCTVDGREVTLLGIAKGSGMVAPRMATMLAFLVTDAAVKQRWLQRALSEVADTTFNALTIDGDTSTSDMVLLLASGVAGNRPLARRHREAAEFRAALHELALDLTRQLARDGEGATRLLAITVEGARTREEARTAARALASSLLLRTAVAGASPAWGRVVSAIGASGAHIVAEKLGVLVNGVELVRKGRHRGRKAEAAVREALQDEEVHLVARLGLGKGNSTFYTCDLTPAYCEENLHPSLPEPR